MAERTACVCMHPPLHHEDFELDPLSDTFSDDADGGEITVETCRHCGTKWLRYFIEHPAFPSSGRWWRGVVTDTELSGLTTNTVLDFLGRLPWHLYGGSYFGTPGMVGKGQPFP